MAFKMSGPSLLKMVSALKKEIPENIKASTRTDYKESKSKGKQNVITNTSNLQKLNDIEDKISFIKEDLFQGRITNREANKRINELKQSAKLFREKHKKDLEKEQDQSKYSDLERYDDDRE
jgi:negative regulator of sigma E activity